LHAFHFLSGGGTFAGPPASHSPRYRDQRNPSKVQAEKDAATGAGRGGRGGKPLPNGLKGYEQALWLCSDAASYLTGQKEQCVLIRCSKPPIRRKFAVPA
jgi:hypothetical protein